jgi:kynureninase
MAQRGGGLDEWGQKYTEALTHNACQWPSSAAHQNWNDRGRDLADQVQHALGADGEVLSFDNLTATPTRSPLR